MDDITHPDYVTQAQLEFLDELRDSGATNMFVAASYLVDEFGVDKRTAREILAYWMKTFEARRRDDAC